MITGVVGFITIVFLTLFMILEGPTWVERGLGLMPPGVAPALAQRRPPDRRRPSRATSPGNLLLSVIAGVSSTIALLIMGVPFALALGLVVADARPDPARGRDARRACC